MYWGVIFPFNRFLELLFTKRAKLLCQKDFKEIRLKRIKVFYFLKRASTNFHIFVIDNLEV